MKIKRLALATFSAVLVAGLATWSLEPGEAHDNDLAPAAGRDAGMDMIFGPPSSVTTSFTLVQTARAEPASLDQPALDEAGEAAKPTTAADASPLERLSIVRQTIRRAGLGSRAMATLVLRNANDYPVKDVEVRCAFKSRDGMISTERVRTIDRTIKPKSRQALPPTLIGHVSVLASDGKCALVSASPA